MPRPFRAATETSGLDPTTVNVAASVDTVDTQDPLAMRIGDLERQLRLVLDRISQLERTSQIENSNSSCLEQVAFKEGMPLELHGKQQTIVTEAASEKVGTDGESNFNVDSLSAPALRSRKSLALAQAQQKIEEMVRTNNGHEIKPNCWEAALFIGESYVGVLGTCFLCLGMFVSVVGEAAFIYVLTFTPKCFINASRPSHESLKEWRYLQGHDQKNIAVSQSLISAVCKGFPLLSDATYQSSLLKDMRAYASETFSPGGILAVLVIVMWFLSVGQEMQECCSFVFGVLRLKRSRKTDMALAEDDSTVIINSISYVRLALVLGLAAVRMSIAIALFVVGALWFASEIDIEALVLNAAAMDFVMNFDETVYYHFAPEVARVVIQQAAPLPGYHLCRWKGINPAPVVMLILSTIAVSLYGFLFIRPQIIDVIAAQAILCGGDQDFVFIDLDYFPQMANLEASTDNNLISRTSQYKVDVLHGYAHRDSSSPSTWLHAAELRQAVEAGALSLYPRKCEDHQDLHRVKLRLDVVDFVPFLQAFAGRVGAVSCEDLSGHCYATNSFWVRFLCPKTCGCDVYRGSLWVRTGCPQTCEENEDYWDQRERLPCEDPSKAKLQNDSIWISWWVGNWTPWYTAQWPQGFAAQLVPGCESLTSNEFGMLPELLCAYGDAAKFSGSLRLFCPESCGCKHSPEGCPMTCAL